MWEWEDNIKGLSDNNDIEVLNGNLSTEEALISTEPNTDAYKSSLVAVIVSDVNDGSITYVTDIFNELGEFLDDITIYNTDIRINPVDFSNNILIPFRDFVINDYTGYSYEESGNITLLYKSNMLEGIENPKNNIFVLMLNPQTAKSYVLPINGYDIETGTIKVTIPILGPYTIISNYDAYGN